jgi:LysR family transcriptional regulator, regulator for bpeEF and oprC
MDRLDVMALFVRVADTGSFSRAARAAGIVQPTVSKQIAALEAHLGAQLLRRTSRGLSLTEAGQDFYESSVRLLGDVKAAESRIGRGKLAPSGLLRVATSAGLGRMYVVPRLPEFFALYPDVAVDLEISERHVNLVEEGIDVAIRIGPLSDSTLVARRIGSTQVVTVAAPAYLEASGEPQTPSDLEHHACVIFMFRGAPRPWAFQEPSGVTTIAPRGPVRTNDAEHIRSAVLAGLGIGHNVSWLFAPDIAKGAVVRILRAHDPPLYPINAVCPTGRLLSSKVKVFIDFLAEVFAAEETLRVR